jgi:dTDP-4-amino-4,6-dideoxygalactose transaminase
VEHAVTGDYVCYSFGPIKHMTCGDGGAVGTRDPEVRASLALLRWYGLDRTSQKDFRCEQNIQKAGMKFHMNDINATIGLTNLPMLRETVAAHRRNARSLSVGIRRLNASWIRIHDESPESNYWVYPVLTCNNVVRERLKKHLAQCGIGASQVHARNDHHAAYSFPNGPLPGLEMFDAQHLNLPCGWWVRDDDVIRILEALDEFVA